MTRRRRIKIKAAMFHFFLILRSKISRIGSAPVNKKRQGRAI
jgi:hypothetical protein